MEDWPSVYQKHLKSKDRVEEGGRRGGEKAPEYSKPRPAMWCRRWKNSKINSVYATEVENTTFGVLVM